MSVYVFRDVDLYIRNNIGDGQLNANGRDLRKTPPWRLASRVHRPSPVEARDGETRPSQRRICQAVFAFHDIVREWVIQSDLGMGERGKKWITRERRRRRKEFRGVFYFCALCSIIYNLRDRSVVACIQRWLISSVIRVGTFRGTRICIIIVIAK